MSESRGCEEAVSALAHYIQDKEITKVMVLTFLDGSRGILNYFSYLCTRFFDNR